ncbi:hypothetical protein [Pseudobacteriovorax antillogorgiicola]|uniref:Uncharacterized protein n=1 Tax=Pseudobacteriovorax antillogorgiicola TaxID=1513793 RepID=A0A1Y6CP84_9BACT|nr:hypothetical protein [Pseudobacteriovorax antillogorgiicola]TCS43476.1 hypothetical protein EDD56_1364 [Pseudobacteriovorax antillogorgiicola]SMF81297.1 hypothetical protein SAMN06296036_13642 [Pseudobacteriovorax antillogorgiicola]
MRNLLGSALLLSALSPSLFASSIIELGREANDAVRNLSHCSKELAEISTDTSWIGKSELWANENGNHGYIFSVFDSIVFETISLGTLEVFKEFIPNPPADGSSYKTHCILRKN